MGHSRLSVHLAARHGDAEAVANAILAGANLEARWRGCTPLQLAADAGSASCVSLLLEAGVDVAAKAEDGAGAIHFAARRGCTEAVLDLLLHGENASARDRKRRNPLHYAASGWGTVTTIFALAQAGADVNARDSRGSTPLHCAATSSSLAEGAILLSLGARTDIRDRSGKTALDEVLFQMDGLGVAPEGYVSPAKSFQADQLRDFRRLLSRLVPVFLPVGSRIY